MCYKSIFTGCARLLLLVPLAQQGRGSSHWLGLIAVWPVAHAVLPCIAGHTCPLSAISEQSNNRQTAFERAIDHENENNSRAYRLLRQLP